MSNLKINPDWLLTEKEIEQKLNNEWDGLDSVSLIQYAQEEIAQKFYRKINDIGFRDGYGTTTGTILATITKPKEEK